MNQTTKILFIGHKIMKTQKITLIKVLYVLIYLIAAFLSFDSLLTSDALESFFSDFLLAGIIIHNSLTTEKQLDL